MISARSMVRILAALLVSARAEAFSLNAPAAAGSSRRGPFSGIKRAVEYLPAAPAPAPVRRGSSAAHSLWTGAGGRARSVALGMGAELATEVTIAELEDREFQLEELEDKDVAETSVVLNKDGSITAGATNGPIPLKVRGKWSFDGKSFRLDIHREFDAAVPYMVSRVLTGYVEEVLTATDTMIISGDIEMDGMDVGFFKMISAPSDIMDSLQHLDEQIAAKRKEEKLAKPSTN